MRIRMTLLTTSLWVKIVCTRMASKLALAIPLINRAPGSSWMYRKLKSKKKIKRLRKKLLMCQKLRWRPDHLQSGEKLSMKSIIGKNSRYLKPRSAALWSWIDPNPTAWIRKVKSFRYFSTKWLLMHRKITSSVKHASIWTKRSCMRITLGVALTSRVRSTKTNYDRAIITTKRFSKTTTRK